MKIKKKTRLNSTQFPIHDVARSCFTKFSFRRLSTTVSLLSIFFKRLDRASMAVKLSIYTFALYIVGSASSNVFPSNVFVLS